MRPFAPCFAGSVASPLVYLLTTQDEVDSQLTQAMDSYMDVVGTAAAA